MPQSSVVEWIAGGTLQRQRRQKPLEDPEANTVQHHSMGPRNHSGCCPTCCSCSSCDGRSEWSTDSPSKTVRFKQPKGILKNTRRVDEEDHICCFACTLSAHCNERHTVGKNGKVYGSSKNCAPKGGKRGADDWGESKSTSNSPPGMKVASENNYTSKGTHPLVYLTFYICKLTKLQFIKPKFHLHLPRLLNKDAPYRTSAPSLLRTCRVLSYPREQKSSSVRMSLKTRLIRVRMLSLTPGLECSAFTMDRYMEILAAQ